MERIGIAASKIAKGNLFLYNLYVVLISFLFSVFLFFIAGASIILALIIIGYVVNNLSTDFSEDWWAVVNVCMGVLTVVVVIFNLFAIIRNFKVKLD